MRSRPWAAVAGAAAITCMAFAPSFLGASPDRVTSAGMSLMASSRTPGTPGISDSLAGKPILKVSSGGLAVGKTLSGSVVITNTSNALLTVTVNQENLATGPVGKPNLAMWAQLTVLDTTTNAQIYSGPVSAFYSQPQTLCGLQVTKQSPCPKWTGAEAHTFVFSLVIPNPAVGSPVNINSYQGTSLTTDFVWTSAT